VLETSIFYLSKTHYNIII